MSDSLSPAPPPTTAVVGVSHEVPWASVLEAYLASALDSQHTRRAYRRHITSALQYLGVATLSELPGARLADFRAQVTASGLHASSQAQAIAALRSFLRWTRTMGAHRLPLEVVELALRVPRATVQRPYNVLSEPEIAAIISSADNARDRALLALLLGAGLRAGEAIALDVPDLIEDHEGELSLHVRSGKGRKDRVVPVRGDVATFLKHYLVATRRRLGAEGPLFRAHEPRGHRSPRGRLTVRTVGYIVANCAMKARIDAKRVSPHSLRHTYAIRALRSGANVIAVQKLLGHANVATTQKYLDHLQLSELRAAVPLLPS